jgi:HD-GYP domain-containing protein (c-di-GMP phosphodiesterase class II)
LIHIDHLYRLEIYDRQLLNLFASNLSMAFENLRLSREIIGTQEELIVKVGEVVETRSHDTAQHVLRVGEFCALLASKIGMDEYATRELKMASALHDIGKIGIPDDILLKPDILTEEEFEVIKTHPRVGYTILKHSTRSMLKTASVICMQHHERWDGKGYPAGIKGEKIDLNARIVAICDVFDSLTHGRLHRDPWDIEQAADYLRKEKNGAFHAQLVDLMLEDLSQLTEINDMYPD